MARLLPFLIVLLAPVIAGAAGYFGARMFRPAPPPATAAAPAAPVSIDLASFAVQIYHPRRIDMLVTGVRIKVAARDAAVAQSAEGKARLRDRGYQILFDAAETPRYHTAAVTPEEVAQTLAAGLGSVAPGLRDVAVTYAVSNSAPRS